MINCFKQILKREQLFTRQNINYQNNAKFSSFSGILDKEAFKDVSLLQQAQQGLQYAKLPFMTIVFEPNKTLQDFQERMAQSYKIFPIKIVDIATESQFASSTPIQFILENDFKIQLFDEWYYICSGGSVLQSKQNYKNYQNNKTLYQLHGIMNSTEVTRDINNIFVTEIVQRIHEFPNKKISSNTIKTLLETELYKLAVKRSNQLRNIEEILDILKNKRESLQREQQQIQQKTEKRAKRTVNGLITFYGIQAFMLQYGTYFLFSWDIIEPITCLCGTFDLALAYFFWLRHNKVFDYESVMQRKHNYLTRKQAKKVKFPSETLEEIDELIQHFQVKKNLISTSVYEVQKAIQQGL